MKNFSVSALALAACLTAFALPASAEPVWTDVPVDGRARWARPGPASGTRTQLERAEYVSDVSVSGNTLSYNYLAAGSWMGPDPDLCLHDHRRRNRCADPGHRPGFQRAWDNSATSMYIWQGSTANKTLLSGGTDGESSTRTSNPGFAGRRSMGLPGRQRQHRRRPRFQPARCGVPSPSPIRPRRSTTDVPEPARWPCWAWACWASPPHAARSPKTGAGTGRGRTRFSYIMALRRRMKREPQCSPRPTRSRRKTTSPPSS
jgi:hypothetical protein